MGAGRCGLARPDRRCVLIMAQVGWEKCPRAPGLCFSTAAWTRAGQERPRLLSAELLPPGNGPGRRGLITFLKVFREL